MRKRCGCPAITAAALAAVVLWLSAPAFGHIKNEASQFPDIEFSDARFDIVMLVGAGIIPETPVFEPDKTLSRHELATWVALSRGLGAGGENPDTAALADAALEAGIVSSLEGEATFHELNTLFFGGEAEVAHPEEIPTKADAAGFIAAHLDTGAGLALLESRGLEPGATGGVAAVATREGHHGSVYVITVGDTTLPMDQHGRVANGPTDLLQWEGRTVRRSFTRPGGDSAVWTYLEAQPVGADAAAEAPPPGEAGAGAGAVEAPPASGPPAEGPGDAAAQGVDRRLLLGLVVAVVLLGFALFFRGRRHS